MRNTRTATLFILMIYMASSALAADDARHYNLDTSRTILKGYDPVSYFTSGKPAKGDPRITTEYNGAIFRFASEANREAFLAAPAKYLPEYGGWCAKAIADKEFVDIDPLTYKITNGRLFLFYKGFFGNALDIWNKDEANLTRRADQHWKEIIAE
jgi:YHS domain-containing protein